MKNHAAGWGTVLGIGALALAGCGGKSKGAEVPKASSSDMGTTQTEALQVPTVDPELCDAKDKKVVTADLDKDGKPDVWKLYATVEEDGTKLEVLTCKQVDFDHDGKKDYVAIYLRTGELIAEEIDLGFKGNIDAREHYDRKSGRVTMIERSRDHGAAVGVWEKYDSNGQLAAIQHDRNGDGKPDMWEQYEKGNLVAILYDDDFDNRVDRREAVKAPPPPANPATAAPPKSEGPAEETPAEPVPAATDATKPAATDAKKHGKRHGK